MPFLRPSTLSLAPTALLPNFGPFTAIAVVPVPRLLEVARSPASVSVRPPMTRFTNMGGGNANGAVRRLMLSIANGPPAIVLRLPFTVNKRAWGDGEWKCAKWKETYMFAKGEDREERLS